MLNRAIPPLIHDAVDFDYILPPIQLESLANGLPLYWLSAGVQEVVEIDWVFPAGIWWEGKPALAQALAGLLKSGTTARTSQQIAEAFERYGASLKVTAGNDFATVTLYSLTKHLHQLLPIVYDILTDAAFPEDELQIYKQNNIQRLLVSMRQCEFVANQKIDALLFGEAHPYGRFTKAEKIEAISRADLRDFYRQHFALSNVRMFMAGKVGPAEVARMNEVFGAAPIPTIALSQEAFSIAAPAERRQSLINDPAGVQGAIRVARNFPTRHHPDFPAMVVLNTLFGGYFGSRLMANIREEKGFTYGIYSSLSTFEQGGATTIHTEVGRDVIAPATAEIYKEMALLCAEPADAEELLLVKNYLLGNLLGDLDGPFQIIQRWRTLILNGLTIGHFDRNIQVYKSVRAEELQALAQKYLNGDDYYEVVVI